MSYYPLNFTVVGEVRSGAGLLGEALSRVPGAVCHTGVIADKEENCREQYERYFGPQEIDPEAGAVPWFSPARWPHAQSFLDQRIFDRARKGERAVGTHLSYRTLARYQLYEYLHQRWHVGDFCVIHVVRNPVACFVSLRQAEQTGAWVKTRARPYPPVAAPVSIDLDDLTQFYRDYMANSRRVETLLPDRAVVRFEDLVDDFPRWVAETVEFLELPPPPKIRPGFQRLSRTPIHKRIANYESLLRRARPELREALTSPTCV